MPDLATPPADEHHRLSPIEGDLLALGFHESPGTSAAHLEEAGDFIGRYRLIELLGSGGFGHVWLAEQTQPIRRQVAVKLIKPGMDSREIIARFEAERQTLALMDHPNIAGVLDAGTTDFGRPYFVLELVRGVPITTYCDTRQLTISQRIDLFIPVCQAVQHAHQKAILHRDLKPSNILVTEIDGTPVPKIIDFGIAKALGNSFEMAPDSSWLRTQAGAIIGTPQYMSPEQAGSVPDVDTRSDIYALGVILYELLTGDTPLEPDAKYMPFEGVLRSIREQEAPRPSSRIAEITPSTAQARKSDPSRLARMLRGDLDWITLKTLEKDRRQRYETATALALDLQAYQRQEPVTAAAPTWSYRFGKFARRHRSALIASIVVVIALLGGIAASLWQASRAEKSRAEAEKNFDRARDAVELFLNEVTDHPVLNAPEFQELRLRLLTQAIPFYEEVAGVVSEDAKFRSHQAWALSRAGSLYFESGDLSKAEAAIRKAIALDERLVAESPQTVDFRRALSQRLHNLGVVLVGRGQPQEAAAVQQRAVEVHDALRSADPANEVLGRETVAALSSLASTWKELGKFSEAEATLRRATEIQQALVTQSPDVQKNRAMLARLHSAHARILADRKAYADAEKKYQDAMALRDELLSKSPGDPWLREPQAADCVTWGATLSGLGRDKEGEKLMRRALTFYAALTQDFPERPSYRREWGVCHFNAGSALWKIGKRDEGFALCEDAAQVLEPLITRHPENAKFRERLAHTLVDVAAFAGELNRWEVASRHLGRALEVHEPLFTADASARRAKKTEILLKLAEAHLRLNNHEQAFQRAWDSAVANPDSWEPWWRGAETLGRCHELAQTDSRLPDQARPNFLEAYARQAVTMLQQAVANGCPNVRQFPEEAKQPWLAERPDFLAVVVLKPGVEGLRDTEARSPVRFTFDYRAEDPGKRFWVRAGDTWTETQPSGKKNTYRVVARRMVNGIPGTELHERAGSLQLFLPDIGTHEKVLRMRRSTGMWVKLGSIENVE